MGIDILIRTEKYKATVKNHFIHLKNVFIITHEACCNGTLIFSQQKVVKFSVTFNTAIKELIFIRTRTIVAHNALLTG